MVPMPAQVWGMGENHPSGSLCFLLNPNGGFLRTQSQFGHCPAMWRHAEVAPTPSKGLPARAHLVCLSHPTIVSNVLPERAESIHLHKETGWGPAWPWPLSSHGAGARCRTTAVLGTCLHSGCLLGPKKSFHTGRSCTLTAFGNAGQRSYSTSPACCHSCQSSDLHRSRVHAHGPRGPAFSVVPHPSSKARSMLPCLGASSSWSSGLLSLKPHVEGCS